MLRVETDRAPLELSLPRRRWLFATVPVLIVLIGALVFATSRLLRPAPAYALVDETTLVVLKGTVQLQRSGGSSFSTVTDNTGLREGDRVRTGPASYASITYFDGSTTKLEPETEIEMRKLDRLPGGGKSISFFQEIGITWNRVERLIDAQSRFETTTATGVAYVRGTEYRVTVDRDKKVTVESVTDPVVVETVVGGVTQSVVLEPGFLTTVEAGRAPSTPEPARPDSVCGSISMGPPLSS